MQSSTSLAPRHPALVTLRACLPALCLPTLLYHCATRSPTPALTGLCSTIICLACLHLVALARSPAGLLTPCTNILPLFCATTLLLLLLLMNIAPLDHNQQLFMWGSMVLVLALMLAHSIMDMAADLCCYVDQWYRRKLGSDHNSGASEGEGAGGQAQGRGDGRRGEEVIKNAIANGLELGVRGTGRQRERGYDGFVEEDEQGYGDGL